MGKCSFMCPKGVTPEGYRTQKILRSAQKTKRVDRNTAYTLKESKENTHMDLSCPFPDYWGNCKLTTLDKQICPTCKACKTAHRPLYLGSRGTETSMVNTTEPGEEALLMTAGQGQAQIPGHHHCLHHKGSSEQTHRTGPGSGASSTLMRKQPILMRKQPILMRKQPLLSGEAQKE